MLIYWLIFSFTCFTAFLGSMIHNKKSAVAVYEAQSHKDKIEYNEKTIGIFWALVSFSLLIFFIGMRSGYGDTEAYIINFESFSINTNIREIFSADSEQRGYDCLMYLFKKYISTDCTAFFMMLSIFQGISVMKLYYKYSSNYFMSVYLFIASTAFTWMMNGLRQFISVCLFIFFFDYIIERKLIKFIIILLIAYSIHETAILWLPIYFIVNFKPWSLKIWICVFLTLLVFFFINEFTDLMDDALEGGEYEGYGSALRNYDDGVSFVRVIVASVPAAIALWRRKAAEPNSNKLIDICTNLSVVSVGVYLLGVVTSGIMVGRVPIYFTLMNYILLPWLLDKAFDGKMKTIMKILCYAFYMIYFIYSFKIGTSYYWSDRLGLLVY